MKALYMFFSIAFTVLILVLSFENISAQCSNLNIFFWPVRQNPTVVFLALAVLGILTGVFYHAFFSKLMEVSDEEEDEL